MTVADVVFWVGVALTVAAAGWGVWSAGVARGEQRERARQTRRPFGGGR